MAYKMADSPDVQNCLVDDVSVCLFAQEHERLVLELVNLILYARGYRICIGGV